MLATVDLLKLMHAAEALGDALIGVDEARAEKVLTLSMTVRSAIAYNLRKKSFEPSPPLAEAVVELQREVAFG